MTRIVIPFGGGLDRASGSLVVDETAAQDLRNARLERGKLRPRLGMDEVSTLTNLAAQDMDDVVALHPFRAAGALVALGFRAADRKGYLFKTNGLGQNAAVIDNTDAASLFATFVGAVGRPRVLMAESYRRLFIAHDFSPYKPGATTLRALTKVYNYDAAAGSKLSTLQANLDGTGAKDVRFRGVVAHLNYIMGWGFGTDADQDRPDVLRVSTPTDPTVFLPSDLFYVGARSDAIRNAVSFPGVLKVFKDSQTYDVYGYDRRTFGQDLADPEYGSPSPRLAVVAQGRLWFWSQSGPRTVAGRGPSSDIEEPLDIFGEEPADLPDVGPLSDAWATFDPVECAIWFVHPATGETATRIYKLAVRDPDNPRWLYDTRPRLLLAGAVLSAEAAAAPPGYPDYVAATNLFGSTGRMNVQHVDNEGDENWELWLRPAAGAWYRAATVAVNGVGTTQYQDVALTPSTNYDAAWRYERGGLYNDGAEDASDPTTWPALSQGTFASGSLAAGPNTFDASDCYITTVGIKDYVTYDFTWENIGLCEILEATVNDVNAATVVLTNQNNGNAFGYAKLEGTTGDWYYWVRGESPLTTPTALNQNPLSYLGPCT